ncbi:MULTISPECIES: hypothetical protein [unclassified Nostoc]|uniref:hypothetical protein n=1 Tax=unclassified Nostoc TaxID=2593658 RepID=UPI002AD226C8|nr:hypothetical protein [Nostoc sp. DedQUE03]MDZ7974735.1 hypothetical protein [Nostoc sp. DedQUE03]MDZ8048048.1 hypothetical protein [Nostoc sp. DedQUE02]
MKKARRATIKIAGNEVEVFQLPDGEYVMSQSQVALAVEKHRSLMLRFLDRMWLEGKLYKDYRSHKIPSLNDSEGRGGNNNPISIIPIDIASAFWMDQAFKGNIKAQSLVQACVQETLKRRCDKAFSQVKTEQEYEQESIHSRETWEQSRGFLRDAHASFINCCTANTFVKSVAHDKITLAVCGKTARELRELEVIEGSPKVGLNHIENAEVLRQIAKVKLEFARYRTGNVDQRIDRAMLSIHGIQYEKSERGRKLTIK